MFLWICAPWVYGFYQFLRICPFHRFLAMYAWVEYWWRRWNTHLAYLFAVVRCISLARSPESLLVLPFCVHLRRSIWHFSSWARYPSTLWPGSWLYRCTLKNKCFWYTAASVYRPSLWRNLIMPGYPWAPNYFLVFIKTRNLILASL